MPATFFVLGKQRGQIRLSDLTSDKFTNREVNINIYVGIGLASLSAKPTTDEQHY